jgi:hypothetical protein
VGKRKPATAPSAAKPKQLRREAAAAAGVDLHQVRPKAALRHRGAVLRVVRRLSGGVGSHGESLHGRF